MAVCVGCGLEIGGDGKLHTKIEPDGGLQCTDAGLALDELTQQQIAILALRDDAAQDARDDGQDVAITSAQSTADTADGKADTALDRIPAKIRWGFRAGTTNGAGDIDFAHTLGVLPASVVVQPHASSATHVWTCVIEATSSTTVNVRIHNTTDGAAMPGQAVGFSWIATSP